MAEKTKLDANYTVKKSMGMGTIRVIAYVVLVLLSLMCLIWFYLLFINATRAHSEITARISFVPGDNLIDNLKKLFTSTLDFPRGILNSAFVAFASSILTVYFSMMTAFAVHAYNFKGKKAVHVFILAIMMIPTQVTSLGFYRLVVDTLNLKDSKTYTLNFTLSPISRPVKMENIFYEFGRWEITKASETELLHLVKLLQDNPNITIELSAHTDMKGNEAFNQELSQKRAQSCCDYLIQKGIEKERLTPVGYGKSKPVKADKALNKQYPWIPVEQELDEAFITGLTEDKQEICNQINRRTEFKVLKTTYKLY